MLSKDGLTLIVLDKGFLVTRMRGGLEDIGYYPTLSAAVKHHMGQSSYNGYLYFKLTKPWSVHKGMDDTTIYLGQIPANDIAALQEAVAEKADWLGAWIRFVDLKYPPIRIGYY